MSRNDCLRPFFTFYGGKWRSAPRYPTPRHDSIVEPFAGSAGYSLRHYRRRVVLVEIDPVIAGTWRYLIERATPAEILSLPDLKRGQSVHEIDVPDPAARWLIGWWLNKGSATPKVTMSAWADRIPRKMGFWCRAVRERIARQLPAIRHWRIVEGDYSEAPDLEATWFIDPPYQRAGRHYRHGSDSIDYRELADFARARKGQVIVCENLGAEWLPFLTVGRVKAKSGYSEEVAWLGHAGGVR